MKNSILVPIDFSPASGNGIKYLYELNKKLGHSLNLLHCYPAQDYNRMYDFEDKEYSLGIKEMLFDFCKVYANGQEKNIFFNTKLGSLVEYIALSSGNYRLLALGRQAFKPGFYRLSGSRTVAIIGKSQCPVLIIPATANFTDWKHIWHVKNSSDEANLKDSQLLPLNIDSTTIHVKSIDQTTFTSRLWQSVVSYVKGSQKSILQDIKEASLLESIDLIILVNDSGNNHYFSKQHILEVIFPLNIPILILRS